MQRARCTSAIGRARRGASASATMAQSCKPAGRTIRISPSVFTPAAIERVASVQGGIGEFAVALFECIASEDPELRVGFRVAAPLTRLLRRGYVGLILAAGPMVAAYGTRRGIRTLAQLRRLVQESRATGPAEWEVP